MTCSKVNALLRLCFTVSVREREGKEGKTTWYIDKTTSQNINCNYSTLSVKQCH